MYLQYLNSLRLSAKIYELCLTCQRYHCKREVWMNSKSYMFLFFCFFVFFTGIRGITFPREEGSFWCLCCYSCPVSEYGYPSKVDGFICKDFTAITLRFSQNVQSSKTIDQNGFNAVNLTAELHHFHCGKIILISDATKVKSLVWKEFMLLREYCATITLCIRVLTLILFKVNTHVSKTSLHF